MLHGNTLGAIPMPNKLMWHLYQTASHVKRHLDTMLHSANGVPTRRLGNRQQQQWEGLLLLPRGLSGH